MSRQMGTVGQLYVCQMTNGSTCRAAGERGSAGGGRRGAGRARRVGRQTEQLPGGASCDLWTREPWCCATAKARQPHTSPAGRTVSQIISSREVWLRAHTAGQGGAGWWVRGCMRPRGQVSSSSRAAACGGAGAPSRAGTTGWYRHRRAHSRAASRMTSTAGQEPYSYRPIPTACS